MSLENGWLDYAALGIGINVALPSDGFPNDLTEIATTVISENSSYGDLRNRLVAEVLNNFMGYYEQLTDRLFLSEYRKRLISLGKPVTVIKNNEQLKATAIDIDNDCHLKVRYENGDEEYLSNGEVSVKI